MNGNANHPTAEQLAKSLAAKFLENGNYEALGAPLSHAAAYLYAQATVIEDIDDYFVEDDGFSGLAVHSVGYTAGSESEKVIIYVVRVSKKGLEAVADEIDGIAVEARLMGKLKAGPTAMSARGGGNLFERKNRIACGSSCAPGSEKYAGTFGALRRAGVKTQALSNNHVFAACNHTPVGMPILAPSTMDSRPGRRAPTEICRHERIVELRSGDPVLVTPMTLDAAVAEVADENVVSSWQGEAVDGFDTPAATAVPVSGMNVKKVGRTTGLALGTVEAYVPTSWILTKRDPSATVCIGS